MLLEIFAYTLFFGIIGSYVVARLIITVLNTITAFKTGLKGK